MSGGGVATWIRIASATVNVNVEVWVGASDGSGSIVTLEHPDLSAPNTMWVGEWGGLTSGTILGDATVSASGTTSPASTPAIMTGHPATTS